jgi:NO-binding membrane sensor protein with MHYT domain
MAGSHDYWLVLLSVIVAIIASYVALDLASRVAASHRSRTGRWLWLAGGAWAMGTGIWAMHFIGMLAFRLPFAVSYDIALTLLSGAAAVLASAFALFVVSRPTLGPVRLLGAGLLMGMGIVAMHYMGMQAMRMQPPIRYLPSLVVLSVVIAVAASIMALWSAFRLRMEAIWTAFWKKAGSAVVMGSGIYGTHYTAIAAARFAPDSLGTATPQSIDPAGLAGTLGGFTLLLLLATLLISAYDAYRAASVSAQVGELSRQLVKTQDEARHRLAAELHAIVGPNLSAATAELALLRPPGLDALGLSAALRWHAGAFESRTGIRVKVTADETLPRPSPGVKDALLRVYIEALNNVAEHAAARRVEVSLEARGDAVVTSIADRGRGIDATQRLRRGDSSGWGLMEERARSVGAQLRIHSGPDEGTRVEFVVSRDKWS